MKNISYILALHSISGLGPIRLKAILDYFKDPKLAWEASDSELIKIGIPKNTIGFLLETRKKLDPQTYAEAIKESSIKWITIFDETYPKLLAQIYDPPVVLYYIGDSAVLNSKCLAVVGSRKMTGYGRMVTKQFTKGLVNAGLTVVSGLARGVDSQVHQTAIEENGKTVAVLGGGLNNIFPPENKGLAAKIAGGFGTVLSEFPPDAIPLPGNFPVRNRIISGLSQGVLVTEAAKNSGSLITARLALDQGRDVFAVPGPVNSYLSHGTADLIKEGASLVIEPNGLLEELGIGSKSNKINRTNLSEDENKILECLENETRHIDEIGRILKFPSPKISALLLKMEISGLVQSLGSGIYCKS